MTPCTLVNSVDNVSRRCAMSMFSPFSEACLMDSGKFCCTVAITLGGMADCKRENKDWIEVEEVEDVSAVGVVGESGLSVFSSELVEEDGASGSLVAVVDDVPASPAVVSFVNSF